MLLRRVLLVSMALALAAGSVWAQGVTTGALSGVVSDPNGDALPGVSIVAVLADTGTRYTSVTDGQGRFRLRNLRPGMYQVEASLSKFQTLQQSNVAVRLGEDTTLELKLRLEAATGELEVFAQSDPLINPTKMGQTSNVPVQLVESLPKIERSLTDLARINPLFNAGAINDGQTVLSVAGRNNRYNNIQIDGAVNNDLFGLADSGTPGGQAATQPISLEAVKELQLLVSPYDVRQGMFSGGGINLVTRSGSNTFAGSVFGYFFDDGYVGKGPYDFPALGTFKEKQYGFRLGGPVMKDKLFFFVNAEISRKDSPSGWSLDGSAGNCYSGCTALEDAQAFSSFLKTTYGYDTGGFGQVTKPIDSDLYFGRLDWNISDSHNLTFRHNYVKADNLILFPSAFTYPFPNYAYTFHDETNSTVAQLDSVISDTMFNQGRLVYQTIKDRRKYVGDPFPSITIQNLTNSSADFKVGSEDYSTANSLDQTITEITDDFTFFAGDHEIVLGTHNELFSFKNLFIQQAFGAYQFNSLADFYAGNAKQYDYTYSNDSQPYDEFNVQQLGFYAGDTWRARSNVSVVLGLRADIPLFPDKPQDNPLVQEIFGYKNSEMPSGNILWSPRIGFNWDINGDGRSQLRGGIGIFAGRSPYVWISNNYGRNGIEQTTLRATGSIPFNPDPFNQPTLADLPGVQGSSQEVNLIDPNFEFPQVWRMNLAYDQRLPWWNLVATVEGLYARVQKDILYQNINLEQTGTLWSGAPSFSSIDSTFTGAYLLTNTDKGEQKNVTFKLERPYAGGVYGFLAYTWAKATTVNEGSSSRAVSNWQYNEAVDPNNPGESTSDFEVKHRLSASIAYTFNAETRWATTVSAYFNRQSGRPFSLIFASNFPSVNGDTATGNDLFYVPSGPDDVILSGGTWDQLVSFLQATGYDKYMGKIAPRNAKYGPWTQSLDLHIGQNIPVPYGELELTGDILNFLNLIDDKSGWVTYVNFGTLTPAKYLGIDQATGKPIYQLYNQVTAPADNPLFVLDNLRSRWRAKLGLRYTF